MSRFAVCLLEFLAFLGIPYLRQLQRFNALAITQLRVLLAEELSKVAFTQAASEAINVAIGIAQATVNEVENTLGGLPLGAFQQCGDSADLVATLRDSFGGVLDYYDKALNEANRVRAFTLVQANATTLIEDKITYLEDLNATIDVVILDLLRKEAAAL